MTGSPHLLNVAMAQPDVLHFFEADALEHHQVQRFSQLILRHCKFFQVREQAGVERPESRFHTPFKQVQYHEDLETPQLQYPALVLEALPILGR